MNELQATPPRAKVRARRAARAVALRRLGFKDYPAYLASALWANTKLRYWRSDLPQDCGLCGSTDDLQLHHMTYERIGRELLTDLTPLCPRCHALVHVLERRGEIGLDFSGLVNLKRAKRNQEAQAKRRKDRGLVGSLEEIQTASRTDTQTRSHIRRIVKHQDKPQAVSAGKRRAIRAVRRRSALP